MRSLSAKSQGSKISKDLLGLADLGHTQYVVSPGDCRHNGIAQFGIRLHAMCHPQQTDKILVQSNPKPSAPFSPDSHSYDLVKDSPFVSTDVLQDTQQTDM